MTTDTSAFLLWALMFAAFGLMVGCALGDEMRRRHCAEEKVEELRERLASACSTKPPQDRQLREIRSVLNDAHRLIHAVSKGLEKRPS